MSTVRWEVWKVLDVQNVFVWKSPKGIFIPRRYRDLHSMSNHTYFRCQILCEKDFWYFSILTEWFWSFVKFRSFVSKCMIAIVNNSTCLAAIILASANKSTQNVTKSSRFDGICQNKSASKWVWINVISPWISFDDDLAIKHWFIDTLCPFSANCVNTLINNVIDTISPGFSGKIGDIVTGSLIGFFVHKKTYFRPKTTWFLYKMRINKQKHSLASLEYSDEF